MVFPRRNQWAVSGCETIAEKDYSATCDQVDIFSGRFEKKSTSGRLEGVEAGTQYCLVFVPEEGSHGEVQITFTESTIGGI